MNDIFRNSALAITLAAGTLCPWHAFAQDAASMPVIMTIHTNIYNYQGPDNSFTIYLGSTEKDSEFYVEGPKTQEYVWVDPYSVGTDADGDKAAIATAVNLSVTEGNNTVTLRGDASKLDYIDLHGTYLSSVELSPELTNLSVIDLSHNELTAIDLSPFRNLGSIDLLDNSFTVPENMKIGTDHPYLNILSVGINEVIDPQLDLKNFPNLLYFSARNNYGLTEVDPTGCPHLISLVLEVTNISSLDVSKNPALDVLNISNTRILDIDLSANTALGELYASHEGSYNDEYKITSIDLSKNANLQRLDLSGNSLKTIDVSNNPKLIMLYLQRNELRELDLSKNTRLASVNIARNYFNFATLPLPVEGWDYTYYQNDLPCYFKYKVGEPIDFSKEVIRAPYVDAAGNTITPATFAAVFVEPRLDNPYELDTDYYTFADGVITFTKPVDENVYVMFHCTAFDDWDLQSSLFKVKTPEDYDLPVQAFAFTPSEAMAGKEVGFKIAARPAYSEVNYPADITVRSGEWSQTFQGVITDGSVPAADNISFTLPAATAPVEVLVTDGFQPTALEMAGVTMSSIDLSQAEGLTFLSVTDAALPSVDLGFNYNLRSLDLSGNDLTTISFSGARGDYEKWNLSEVNLSHNRLRTISATVYDALKTLDLSYNNFSDFDFRYYTGLQNLDMSNNRLSGTVDMSTVAGIVSLNLADNNISGLTLTNWRAVKTLDLSGNRLSFATLPLLSGDGIDYSYAPQQKLSILPAGAAINLSDQNVNGNTTFVWKYADDGSEVAQDLFSLDGGVTRFGDSLLGKKLFCELTNPAFADFDDDPLVTTEITVMGRPENLVASFTTSRSGEASIGFQFNTPGSHSLYIDWFGDGSQFEEYISDSNGRIPYSPGVTIAGKTAKVYTYGDPSEVSMLFLNNTPLSDFDATPMTKAEAFNIHNAGLSDGKIKIPASDQLYEIVFDGNNFETQTFFGYKGLRTLNLANNKYTSFDMSIYPSVMFAQLADNQIAQIKFGANNSLYQIDLTNNKLEEINLYGLPELQELLLADNLFKTIDLTPVKAQLRALNLAGNYFTFATLPRYEDFDASRFNTYFYANQQPITVECVDGMVNLSSQAKVGDVETVYRWFLGDKQSDVYYDDYYEEIIGEELEGPSMSDKPEFSVEDGVTSFYYTQKRRVICAMTNAALPNLILYTTPTEIDKAVSGVETVATDVDAAVDVFTLTGVRVMTGVSRAEAVENLPAGIYVIGREKVIVK